MKYQLGLGRMYIRDWHIDELFDSHYLRHSVQAGQVGIGKKHSTALDGTSYSPILVGTHYLGGHDQIANELGGSDPSRRRLGADIVL